MQSKEAPLLTFSCSTLPQLSIHSPRRYLFTKNQLYNIRKKGHFLKKGKKFKNPKKPQKSLPLKTRVSRNFGKISNTVRGVFLDAFQILSRGG